MTDVEALQEEVGGAERRTGGPVAEKGTAKTEEQERGAVGAPAVDGSDVGNA